MQVQEQKRYCLGNVFAGFDIPLWCNKLLAQHGADQTWELLWRTAATSASFARAATPSCSLTSSRSSRRSSLTGRPNCGHRDAGGPESPMTRSRVSWLMHAWRSPTMRSCDACSATRQLCKRCTRRVASACNSIVSLILSAAAWIIDRKALCTRIKVGDWPAGAAYPLHYGLHRKRQKTPIGKHCCNTIKSVHAFPSGVSVSSPWKHEFSIYS